MHPDLMLHMGLIMIIKKESRGVDVVMAALQMGAKMRDLNKEEEQKIQTVVDIYFS